MTVKRAFCGAHSARRYIVLVVDAAVEGDKSGLCQTRHSKATAAPREVIKWNMVK
jgi:hypothetical protein